MWLRCLCSYFFVYLILSSSMIGSRVSPSHLIQSNAFTLCISCPQCPSLYLSRLSSVRCIVRWADWDNSPRLPIFLGYRHSSHGILLLFIFSFLFLFPLSWLCILAHWICYEWYGSLGFNGWILPFHFHCVGIVLFLYLSWSWFSWHCGLQWLLWSCDFCLCLFLI